LDLGGVRVTYLKTNFGRGPNGLLKFRPVQTCNMWYRLPYTAMNACHAFVCFRESSGFLLACAVVPTDLCCSTMVILCRNIGWSKSHATDIKIFIDGCNSAKFDWINEHTKKAVTIQKPTQVTSCCNLLAPVRQLSFNSRSARMSFSQVQRVFIVERYLASRSYLTCQNEFRDTFSDSPVPNKSTISRLVNRFLSLQKHFTRLHQT
jgi:hypothetical protein